MQRKGNEKMNTKSKLNKKQKIIPPKQHFNNDQSQRQQCLKSTIFAIYNFRETSSDYSESESSYSESSSEEESSEEDRKRGRKKVVARRPQHVPVAAPIRPKFSFPNIQNIRRFVPQPQRRSVKDRFFDKSRKIPNDVYFGDVKGKNICFNDPKSLLI